ncbi:MAG: hypothetical protein ACP5IA_00830 [Sediminispirochaetaceae bacterium]
MKLKVDGVRPPLEFVPPKFSGTVLRLVSGIAPIYIKKSLGLSVRPPEHMDRLVREYLDFFSDTSKLILVFRHVHVNDAQVIFYLLNKLLPAAARRLNMRFPRRPHAHFLYGRGVPVWGGKWLEWLFSRMGGIPVFHRKLDRQGLDVVRAHLLDGRYPVALAPEGQVTYHNGIVHPIEPGFAQLALWAGADLEAKGLGQDVRILPISQYYRYGRDGEKVLRELIDRLQEESGVDAAELSGDWGLSESAGTAAAADLQTLKALRIELEKTGAALFTRIEEFYRRYYGLKDLTVRDGGISEAECSRRRVERLVDAVLRMQERKFGIVHPPEGFTPRIFVVRQAGWNRIFRQQREAAGGLKAARDSKAAGDSKSAGGPGSTGPEAESGPAPLESSLNDFLAVEAGLFARHLELVDLMAYMQPEHALESDDVNRHIELALNLLDAVSRLEGGTIGQRHDVRPCEVSIRIGEPLSLRELSAAQPGMTLRQKRQQLIDEVTRQFVGMAE